MWCKLGSRQLVKRWWYSSLKRSTLYSLYVSVKKFMHMRPRWLRAPSVPSTIDSMVGRSLPFCRVRPAELGRTGEHGRSGAEPGGTELTYTWLAGGASTK
jgi:hypothetical protein